MSDPNRKMHQVVANDLASAIFKESVTGLIVHGRPDHIPVGKADAYFAERCKRLAELSLRAAFVFEDARAEAYAAQLDKLAAARAAREAAANGVEA